MAWVDIVFIGLIVVFGIVGLSKGLFESILGIFSSVLSVIVAILVSTPVSNFINKIVNADKFFSDLLIKWKWISQDGANIVGKHFSAEQIGKACTIVLSIIAVWLLIKLAIWLLSRLFDSASSSNSALSGLNRVLGLIFGAIKGFLIGVVGLGLAAILSICGITGIKDTLEKNKFSNFVYGYVSDWIKNTLEDRIEDVLGKSQDSTDNTNTDNTNTDNNNQQQTNSAKPLTTTEYVTLEDGTRYVITY